MALHKKLLSGASRLCRLMCGGALPRRPHALDKEGFAPGPGYALTFWAEGRTSGKAALRQSPFGAA
jgi:hypothetical protein